MSQDRKPVRIQYRKFASPRVSKDQTFEGLIRSAMDTVVEPNVKICGRFVQRIWGRNEDSLLINLYFDNGVGANGFVFGDIVQFSRGHMQALLDESKPDAPVAVVEQITAPAEKEYIHSLMYWMVKGDNVFVLQSASLKTDTLEEYFGWLLGEKTKHFDSAMPVVLDARFDSDAVGGDLSDITEVVVGGTYRRQPDVEPVGDVLVAQEQSEERSLVAKGKGTWGKAIEVLRSLGTANIQEIIDEIPPDAELSVSVHIGYKARKKNIDRTALKDLATGLRNIPDSQILVKAKGGSKSVDGSIKLHYDAKVKYREIKAGDEPKFGSLLDPDDVVRAMYEAYTVMSANGKIK